MSSEPFRYYLRVRYSECDMQGVVFNARYGEYVDLAMSELLRVTFPDRSLAGDDLEVQLVRQLTEWKAPARSNDVLLATVETTRLGTTSFTLVTRFEEALSSRLIATAETVYVVVDPKTWAKRPLTADERTRLESGGRGKCIDHAGFLMPSTGSHA
jgi:acyl-CoA thioester hydrolase